MNEPHLTGSAGFREGDYRLTILVRPGDRGAGCASVLFERSSRISTSREYNAWRGSIYGLRPTAADAFRRRPIARPACAISTSWGAADTEAATACEALGPHVARRINEGPAVSRPPSPSTRPTEPPGRGCYSLLASSRHRECGGCTVGRATRTQAARNGSLPFNCVTPLAVGRIHGRDIEPRGIKEDSYLMREEVNWRALVLTWLDLWGGPRRSAEGSGFLNTAPASSPKPRRALWMPQGTITHPTAVPRSWRRAHIDSAWPLRGCPSRSARVPPWQAPHALPVGRTRVWDPSIEHLSSREVTARLKKRWHGTTSSSC